MSIKLNIELINSECWKNSTHLKLWIYCLLRANRADKVITHGGQTVKVPRGSFITGRHKISEDTGISERKIRTFLEAKKASNDLSIESCRQFSLVTVCNYRDYAVEDDPENGSDDQPLDHRQLLSSSLLGIKDNYNEIKDTINVGFSRKSNVSGDPEFDVWWNNYKNAVRCPYGGRAKALTNYKSCRNTFSVEEINIATRNYLIECRKFNYPTKHGSTFLNPTNELIEQYQTEQTINQQKTHESLLDAEWHKIKSA